MARIHDVAVVGGGASGLTAAIAAARQGAAVVIAERMPRPGKKILVTGGGRCNLSHEALSAEAFTSTHPELVRSILAQAGAAVVFRFFHDLGLLMRVEEGRVFPVTNQAASVLKVLLLELRKLSVEIETGFETESIRSGGSAVTIASRDGRLIKSRAAILAAGGRSYPALGSDGSGYRLARSLGHRIVPPVPSAVPLLVKDRLCHALQGQKLRTRAQAWVEGIKSAEAEGDLLFTSYGLSGTAVLDVSEPLSIALNRGPSRKKAEIVIDLAPFLDSKKLAALLESRIKAGWSDAELTAGILPEKFGALVPLFLADVRPGEAPKASALAALLKAKRFLVQGTRGWNEAEFTCGGVDAREVDPATLASQKDERIFLAGEILDVQGPRGGYNLGWAWASGLVAGKAAAAHL